MSQHLRILTDFGENFYCLFGQKGTEFSTLTCNYGAKIAFFDLLGVAPVVTSYSLGPGN